MKAPISVVSQSTPQTPQQFIDAHVTVLNPLLKKAMHTWWKAYTLGKPEFYEHYGTLIKELKKLYNNPDEYALVTEWMQSEKDPSLKRQLTMLYLSYLSCQGDFKLLEAISDAETNVEMEFNTFRAVVDGKTLSTNDVKHILLEEKDSALCQKAWEASKQQGAAVASKVLELVDRRNKLARSLGFKNYYVFALACQEQTEEEVAALVAEVERVTHEPFRALKSRMDGVLFQKFSIPQKELKPWHYGDPFFQSGPHIDDFSLDVYYSPGDVLEIAKGFYDSIGFPVQQILAASDLYEREGKYPHACANDIDREGDVRIIQNVKHNEYWMSTTLHELGHAVYWKYMDQNIPFLLRDTAHTFVTEAIAMFFERLSKNPAFLQKYTSYNDSAEIRTHLKQFLTHRQLIFARWVQVMFHFERGLYENPSQNLNKLWWQLIEKYQMIPFSRDAPDWASKIHLVSSPVYYHNYLLGELLASQLHEHIITQVLDKTDLWDFNYAGEHKLSSYLKSQIFDQGKFFRWDALVQKATGKSLSAKAYQKQFFS